MTIRGSITYVGDPEASKRGLAKAARTGMRDAARHWKRRMLPRHFQRSARARYGYAKRESKYVRRKAKHFGSGNDLVLTGRLKAMLTRVERIRGGPKIVTVSLDGPPYFFEFAQVASRQWGEKPTRDVTERAGRPLSRMAAEVTAVTKEELDLLAKIVDRKATRILQNLKTRRVQRM